MPSAPPAGSAGRSPGSTRRAGASSLSIHASQCADTGGGAQLQSEIGAQPLAQRRFAQQRVEGADAGVGARVEAESKLARRLGEQT